MPSVNMRRTTRVFGMVKAADGARVLRSGRHLWAKSAEGKLKKGSEKVEWYSFVDSKGSGKQIGWAKEVNTKQEDDAPFLGDVEYETEPDPDARVLPAEGGNHDSDKLFGVVYSRRRQRKRKAAVSELDEKKYGIHFTRRMKRAKDSNSDSIKAEACTDHRGLAFVVKSASSSEDTEFSGFLFSLLSYMRRASLEISDLYAFLTESSIRGVYLSRGVHFLWNSASAFGSGICKLFGTRDDMPMFLVNFSTVPHCFRSFHFDVIFKHRYMRTAPVYNLIVGPTTCDDAECVDSASPCLLPDALPDLENHNSRLPVRILKSDGRPAPSRLGLISRGILKRRRSFRSSRTKNSSFGVNKNNGALASDLVSAKRNGFPFSSVVASRKVRRSSRRKPAHYINDISTVTAASAAVLLLPRDMDSITCSANLLVIESDKCFREEGATVLLEASESGEWCLAVKKDGLARYMHKVSEPMKFAVQNRFTHANVWTGDNGWRLEFSDRDEWLKFKDIYKECFDRNRLVSSPTSTAAAAPVKVIPVPGVREVPDYEDACLNTFSRPIAYISMIGDEVSRAMVRRASYDMDCDDEEWLQRFNIERQPTNDGIRGDLEEETFELMIDVFEKAFYNNPYDLSNDRPDANLCVNLEREVVEAVYSYWVKKRKHKRSALIRALQLNSPRKVPVVPKPSLRKKRSFKRQGSQHGRGKQPGLLQALAAERRLQGQKSLQKLEEAKTSASRSLELAITKRRRAQFLMGNANLAAYRATMALRIAEAAGAAVEFLDEAATHFIDQWTDPEAMSPEGDV